MKCPKCKYERQPREDAPQTHCPACGVVYAKVDTGPQRVILYSDPPRRSWGVGVALALLVLAAGGYALAPLAGLGGRDKLKNADFSRARIVVYSISRCTDCEALRRKLEANRVPFEEHYIDKDQARMREMFAKLKESGHTGAVEPPTLEVNGQMLVNNPAFDRIIKVALR